METRQDAALNAFTQRSLEEISSKLYDTPYSAVRFAEILPVNTGYNPGAEAITWRLITQFGQADFIRDYSKDFARVDVAAGDNSNVVKGIGDSYSYSIQELRAAMLAGYGLSSAQAMAARDAIMRKIDSLAAVGESDYSITGFLNDSNIGSSTLTTGSVGNTWADKTGTEILADLETMYNDLKAAISDTGVDLRPNALVMPPSRGGYLKKRLPEVEMTVENFWLSNYPEFRGNLHEWVHASTAGAASATRSVMYRKDPALVEVAIPLPFTQHAPEKRNLAFVVNCEARTAGAINRYPVAATAMDGM